MMNTEKNKIEKAVEDGLSKPAFDLTQDYAELGLDSFLDNPALKELPLVKSIVGVVRGGMAIREIWLAKKLLTFLSEFHNGKLTEERKQEFLTKFREDTKYRASVVEHVVVLNDRFISVEKSKILANLFQAHINGKFVWEAFCQLSECLDTLHTRAFAVLHNSANSDDPFHFKTHDYDVDGGGVLFSAGLCIVHGNHYSVNAYGQYLYYYGIKGDIDFTFPKQESN